MTLSAVFDDVAMTVTFTGMGPAPTRPPDVPDHLWHPQSGPGFECTLPVSKKNVTVNPVAEYLAVGADGFTVERWRVEYRDGAWQMPGTRTGA